MASLKKVVKGTNPFTQKEMDLSFSGIISMIVGVMVILFVWTAGQKGARKVEDISKGKLDGTPDAPFESRNQGSVKGAY